MKFRITNNNSNLLSNKLEIPFLNLMLKCVMWHKKCLLMGTLRKEWQETQ